MINCIGFNWQTSPSCTELETITSDWVAKMCGLHTSFLSTGKGGGVIQGSASESVIVAIVAARERVLRPYRENGASETELATITSNLIAYASTQTHSCTQRACIVLNLKFKTIQTDERYRLRGEALKNQMECDLNQGLIPFYLTANMGKCKINPVRKNEFVAKALIILQAQHPQELWMHCQKSQMY